eukprot:1160346-Rhodomonas_salina.5
MEYFPFGGTSRGAHARASRMVVPVSVALVILCMCSLRSVPSASIAVVTTFGKVEEHTLDSGSYRPTCARRCPVLTGVLPLLGLHLIFPLSQLRVAAH